MSQSDQEWSYTFRTNIEAMFHLAKAVVPHMRPGSSIINTTSIQSDKPSPMLLAYASTKGAVSNFTAGLAQMLGSKGIRVNAVAPGPIWTPLIPSTMPPEKVKSFGKDTPLGRAGQPAELAPIYVLLASQAGSYITGQVYGVTAGDYARQVEQNPNARIVAVWDEDPARGRAEAQKRGAPFHERLDEVLGLPE